MTEVGIIPEDWKIKSLEEISDVKTGPFGSALHASDYVKGGTPIITVEHLGNIHIDRSKDIPEVDDIAYNRLKQYSLKNGDIVFSRVGAVDRCSRVFNEEDGWLFSSRLLRVRMTKDINSEYLTWHLSTNTAKKRILSVAVGLAMPSINSRILRDFKVVIPSSIEEQKKISQALSTIDEFISALESQICKKKQIKEGTMQLLLTGKKRLPGFDGEWKHIALGDILDYEQPTSYLVSSTEYVSVGVPVLTAGKTFILGYTNDKHGIYEKLPVIIFDDFVTESKFVDFPFKAKSSAMKMLSLKDKNNNLRFVYEIMQLIDFPMTDHKRYWIGEYSKILIYLPSPEEQSAIANVLADMDSEIQTLEAERDKYLLIKQGMMQDLLTGKTRLV